MYQECRHIKSSGSKCHSPALKSKAYCYYHFRAHARAGKVQRWAEGSMTLLEMPALDDRTDVQIALSEVVQALATDRIEFKRASLMIYALQVASANAKNLETSTSDQPVREALEDERGLLLAPETTTYEMDDDEYEPDEDHITLAQLLMRDVRKRRKEAEALAAQDEQAADHPDELET